MPVYVRLGRRVAQLSHWRARRAGLLLGHRSSSRHPTQLAGLRWLGIGDPDKDPDSQPGSWGGHCTIDYEYDPDTYGEITWGEELLETLGFRKTYHDEAHVVVAKEMLSNTGVGPSGVQWPDLLSDLSKLPPVQS
jgi:hypothetical protein